jgi:hypothetical protein
VKKVAQNVDIQVSGRNSFIKSAPGLRPVSSASLLLGDVEVGEEVERRVAFAATGSEDPRSREGGERVQDVALRPLRVCGRQRDIRFDRDLRTKLFSLSERVRRSTKERTRKPPPPPPQKKRKRMQIARAIKKSNFLTSTYNFTSIIFTSFARSTTEQMPALDNC